MAANTYHEEEALGKAYDGRLMKRLLKYARPYRFGLISAVILLIGGSVLQLFLPVIVQIAIDKYLLTKDVGGLGRISLVYGGILLASFILSYLQLYITMVIGQKVQYDMRMEIFEHLQKLHML